MANINYNTITATNNSGLKNSSYMYGDETSIYESPYVFDQTFNLGPQRDSLKFVIPLTIIYGLIFVTGVIGNISTCIVIKKNRSMHTATNYYLFSLAISDFLLLLSGVPQEIYLVWYKYPYVFGEVFCVCRGILAEMSANATVLTITAFTIERYLAICHPFRGQGISKLSRAIRIILLIWSVSIITAIPQALQFGVVSNLGVDLCIVVREIIEHSFQLSTFIFFFAPMSIIFVLYLLIGLHLYRSNLICGNGAVSGRSHNDSSKSQNLDNICNDLPSVLPAQNSHGRRSRADGKSAPSDTILYRYSGGSQVSAVRGGLNQVGTKRVLKMLVAVVICFFLCWAPFHAQRLIAVYGIISTGNDEERAAENIVHGELIAKSTTISPTPTTDGVLNAENTDHQDNHVVIYHILTYISGVLYYLSTCINPLLYNLMSNKFRQAFKSVLFGIKSSNAYRTENSKRSLSRRPTTNSSSAHRGSDESEMLSRVSLLQTISNERKNNPHIVQ